MITKPQIKHLQDIWKDYAVRILATNPEWWGVTKRGIPNFYIYHNTLGGDKRGIEEVFSYDKFKCIVDTLFIRAKYRIIQGEAFVLGNSVGKICARRVERNHKNKQINWLKTKMQPKVMNEKGKLVPKTFIYHTDDDYCRIGFHKTSSIKNETVYEFKPAGDNHCGTGFAQEFSKALIANPLLKYRYLYYPLELTRKRSIEKLQKAKLRTA